MIIGLGSDIIEVDRIAKAIDRHGESFLARIFTAQERDYCDRFNDCERHYAGRFAGKEAIAKALGTGISKEISWQDIEILNDPLGKPQILLSSNAQKRFNNPHLLITISHCKHYATATCIIPIERNKVTF